MNVLILGGAGFIGTNLAFKLLGKEDIHITIVDRSRAFLNERLWGEVDFVESEFLKTTDFDKLLKNQEVVFHMVSTIIPANSNNTVPDELDANIISTSYFLESCVRNKVKKIIFMSSGGTVYGKEVICPINETAETNPINTYGVQKLCIEKILYMYYCMYGLDYRVIRLANPYGPYQRPNGKLGALTTFTYNIINQQEIVLFGDGSVVRDYIYIDDAVNAICTISFNECKYKVYNVGSGVGISLNELIQIIKKSTGKEVKISMKPGRAVDVPENYLDINRYENEFGKMCNNTLEQGINKTIGYLKSIS